MHRNIFCFYFVTTLKGDHDANLAITMHVGAERSSFDHLKIVECDVLSQLIHEIRHDALCVLFCGIRTLFECHHGESLPRILEIIPTCHKVRFACEVHDSCLSAFALDEDAALTLISLRLLYSLCLATLP